MAELIFEHVSPIRHCNDQPCRLPQKQPDNDPECRAQHERMSPAAVPGQERNLDCVTDPPELERQPFEDVDLHVAIVSVVEFGFHFRAARLVEQIVNTAVWRLYRAL